MRNSHLLYRVKSKLRKITGIAALNIIETFKNYFNRILFQDQDIITEKDSLRYWKNRIFFIVSVCMTVFAAPLFFYGAYMYYISGKSSIAIFEILLYAACTVVLTRNTISVGFRKIFIILTIYFTSIVLLITTGVKGNGMACVVFSLVLTGCMLEKRQIFQVIGINLLAFSVLTFLLQKGYFDNTYMETYKGVWFISFAVTQVGGNGLLFVINMIYIGLEKQANLIKESKELLSASEIKHKAMIANISDVIAVLDEDGIVKFNSPNIMKRFGWSEEEVSGKPLWEKIHAEDREFVRETIFSLLENADLESTIEARYICKDDIIRHIELTAVNLTKDTRLNGILINYHDISERKAREEKILKLSYQDSLTGLYNRTFFENEKERLDSEMHLPLSVIVGDINGLKIINDSLGHEEGDKLLVAIAGILGACCRKSDIAARIGGDEFAILLPRTSIDTAAEIVKNINLSCQEYNKKVSGELYHTSISLGYAEKAYKCESLDSIFKTAEDYMYKHKLLESRSLHSSILSSMKTALFEKSQETEEHAQRLVKLTRAVGQVIGLTNQQFDELELFSTLHDIGKIGIDDQILNKPGKLTESEWIEMKKHSEVGYRIAMASPELMSIAEYILSHHERWDGKGYPQGLEGERIPLLSRILAVADSYDAMTEDRPYRRGMSKQAAIDEIIRNAGTQFDPVLAKIFVEIVSNEELMPEFKDIEEESKTSVEMLPITI